MAVFTSGILPTPVGPEGQPGIAGIDWMRIERNPMPGEPDIKTYHYVVGRSESGKSGPYPVWGPYKEGCFVAHWTTDSGLTVALRPSTNE